MDESGTSQKRLNRLAGAGRFARSRWLTGVTYMVAAGALAYVLWHLSLSDLREGVSQMIWWPVVLAVVVQIVPRLMQALRWGYLLRPIRVRIHHLVHAIYVSLLMNGILPMCPSDLVRGVMVARRTRTGTARIFFSQAVERAADGIVLALVVWLSVRGLQVPTGVSQALLALIVLLGVSVVLGLILVLQRRRLHGYIAPREPDGRIGKRVKSIALEVLAGAKAVRVWTMPLSLSAGLGIVVMQVVTMWLMLHAYHIQLSFLHAAALVGIISIGTLIPNAPASIGAWQFFCILGLGLFGVPAEHAAAFSVVAFAIWTVPTLLFGVVALVVSPVSWAELRGHRRRGTAPVRPA